MLCRFPRRLSFSALIVGAIVGFFIYWVIDIQPYKPYLVNETGFMDSHTLFDNFNNATGVKDFIVPNIIHFIRFQNFELGFIDYVVLKAAMRNHRPDKFYYHTDVKDAKCQGKYWEWVKKDQELWSRIEVKYLEMPTEIFGQKLSDDFGIYHGSDISRLRILKKYGGIYLDNDCFVIQSLDKYRKFECVVNWDEDQFLGNQVIIANKNARILPHWLNTYKVYRIDEWYYNGGERPTVEILYRHPELIHRVKGNFGADTGVSSNVYADPQMDWRRLDIIHLLAGHRSYMDPNFNITPVLDENTIRTYPYPFGEMAREVLDIPHP
ncbi:uncharacterized protein LOC116927145 isoform X1 [Daphnia magna]|uniref:uncharacterized protein LOC116927145 isoform X1 n=1 Tax=Daphnia magna TaxID=35525 RepID=UPI001E1BBA5E|nr:uncharacterized protein LOC116927145 isoform X1 [Daphnia magna]